MKIFIPIVVISLSICVNSCTSPETTNNFETLDPSVESPLYSFNTESELVFNEGIEIIIGETGEGQVVYMLNDGLGNGLSLMCRCPKGFTGTCVGSIPTGEKFATCSGTCQHSELGDKLTTRCGWYTKKGKTKGLINEIILQSK